MNCFGLTDRGKTRTENQDSFLIENCEKASCSILALCDGMGGANAGGLASQLTAKAFVNYVFQHLTNYTQRMSDYPRILREACEEANGVAYAYSQFGENLTGMGTTLVAAVLKRNGSGYVLNVGDSRAYQLHRRSLKQISKDHTETISTDMAKKHKPRLTKHLGIRKDELIIHPSQKIVFYDDIEKIILCSDGITDRILDEEIERILKEENSPKKCCETLVKLANENGGTDNITVMVFNLYS